MSLDGATRVPEGVGGKGAGACEKLLRELLEEMEEIAGGCNRALEERIQRRLEKLEHASEEEEGGSW
jgi:hypothetical protein